MGISREQVRHVAHLARLRLTEAEEESLARDLDGIVRHIDELTDLDLADVPPTAAIVAAESLREDAVSNHPETEPLFANAPDRSGTLFRVPRILDSE